MLGMDHLSSGAELVIDAPAKLNLFLELLAKRPDGFHEIETLMTTINIYDRLYVKSHSEGQTQLTCSWASGMEAFAASHNSPEAPEALDAVPLGNDNIAWKAVERLRERAGSTAGIAIHLIKRIPAAAGLGGASSDAAAALMAANQLWQLGWTRLQLAEVSAEIGSDVPFFLFEPKAGAGMAICRGRGEQVEALEDMPQLHFVLTRPPAGLPTPKVYQRCRIPTQPRSVLPLVEEIRSGRHSFGKLLLNRLQPPAETMSPWIGRLSKVFSEFDCIGHQMSGSGSTYFGICRSARQARRLASRIRAAGSGLTFQASTVPCSTRIKETCIETAPL